MSNQLSVSVAPGSVVLITAGASGIGKVVAETFLALGSKVHVCDIDEDAIQSFLRDNPQATATLADVSVVDEVERIFSDIESRYGRLDVLVNNAGVSGPSADLHEIDPADWDRTLAIDLHSVFYCSRKAIPYLKQRGGSIINMSSTAGIMGCPGRAPYVASKWAIVGLTKTMAMELGKYGVRVNAVCPGSVSGERIDRVVANDARRQGKSEQTIRDLYQRQVSMRQFVSAIDVANMITFLASDLARLVSGQAIGVDGHTETLSSGADE